MGADAILSSKIGLRREIEEKKENPRYAKLMDFIENKYEKEIDMIEDGYPSIGMGVGCVGGLIGGPLIWYLFNPDLYQAGFGGMMCGFLMGSAGGAAVGRLVSEIKNWKLNKKIEREVLTDKGLVKKIIEE